MKKITSLLAIAAFSLVLPAQAMGGWFPSLSVSSIFSGFTSVANLFTFKLPFTQKEVGLGTATAVVVPTYIATKVLVPSRHQNRIRAAAIVGTAAYVVCSREMNLYRELEAIKNDTGEISKSVSTIKDDVAGIKRDMATQANVDAKFNNVNNRFNAVDQRLGELVTSEQLKTQLKAQEDTLLAVTNGLTKSLTSFRTENADYFKRTNTRLDSIDAAQQETNKRLGSITNDLAATRTAITTAVSASESRMTANMNGIEQRLTQLITQRLASTTGLVTGGHSTAAIVTTSTAETINAANYN